VESPVRESVHPFVWLEDVGCTSTFLFAVELMGSFERSPGLFNCNGPSLSPEMESWKEMGDRIIVFEFLSR
jgi:hypothetical protein